MLTKFANSKDRGAPVVANNCRRMVEPLLIVLWLAVLMCGFYGLIDYDLRPTAYADPGASWPAGATVERSSAGSTLIVFLHPHCACSQATISELTRVLEQAQRQVTPCVYFVRPPGTPANWEQGALWRAAAKIPGVRILVDLDGAEAARFGAESSGQALLYDADGRLAFAGGLTASRGHYGANSASDRLIASINSDLPTTASADVFGCPLTGLVRAATPEAQP